MAEPSVQVSVSRITQASSSNSGEQVTALVTVPLASVPDENRRGFIFNLIQDAGEALRDRLAYNNDILEKNRLAKHNAELAAQAEAKAARKK